MASVRYNRSMFQHYELCIHIWHWTYTYATRPDQFCSIEILTSWVGIAELEEYGFRLASLQARSYLEHGRSNSLVSIEPFTDVDGLVSILNAKTWVLDPGDYIWWSDHGEGKLKTMMRTTTAELHFWSMDVISQRGRAQPIPYYITGPHCSPLSRQAWPRLIPISILSLSTNRTLKYAYTPALIFNLRMTSVINTS